MKVMRRVDSEGRVHLRKCSDKESVQFQAEGWTYANRDEWKRLLRRNVHISETTKEVIL